MKDDTVDDVLNRVWKRVKDDVIVAEKIQSLANSGIDLGGVNVDKMLRTKEEHPADTSSSFKWKMRDLVSHNTNYVPTPELEFYLYNTACQENLKVMRESIEKLFNLTQE